MITVFFSKSFTNLQPLEAVSYTNFIRSDKHLKSAPFKNADRWRCSTVRLSEKKSSKNVCPIQKIFKVSRLHERR